MNDRQLAIKELEEAPENSLLVVIPKDEDIHPELWITVKTDEDSYPFFRDAVSFDKATKEDICCCIHCGATTLIFEDVCPNCNSAPYPEEYENA